MPIPIDNDLTLRISKLMLSGKLRKGGRQSATRTVGFLAGTAIAFCLAHWLSLEWYFAVPLGAVGYLCVRYIGDFMRERRYIKNTMDAAKRGQISN